MYMYTNLLIDDKLVFGMTISYLIYPLWFHNRQCKIKGIGYMQ